MSVSCSVMSLTSLNMTSVKAVLFRPQGIHKGLFDTQNTSLENKEMLPLCRCVNVVLSTISNYSLTRVYLKKTFSGVLSNYFSFTSYSYKVFLIKALIDRVYKINKDITKLMDIFKKNLCAAHLIEKVINHYITGTQSNHCPWGSLSNTSPKFYFKLPYIGYFSVITWKKIRHFIKRYCNDLDIKLPVVFHPLRSATCLAWKPLSLAGSVHMWFTSLHVLGVMPVTLTKWSNIFHMGERAFSQW